MLCSLPLIATLLTGCAAPPPMATGYAEGEDLRIAPVASAEIRRLAVGRGDHVSPGQILVEMDAREAEIALAEAEAGLARAASQLQNLREGRRAEEIRVIEAGLASARAAADEAARTSARLDSLERSGAATQSQRDDAATALTVARARVAEVEANLAVARLPARPAEIAAAEATLAAAQAARDHAAWTLDKRRLTAPVAGTVTDLLRRPGELAGPTAPVLTLLPDDGVKLRLYVPEAQVAQIAQGTVLPLRCDGCAPDLTATVTWIAEGPEFTPPVIYSLQNRQKLVYMIEARPAGPTALKPGQIVDALLPAAAP